MSAPASSSSSSSGESSAPSSPEVPKKATKSPSRSPSASKQARRSPTEEYTRPSSCETPEASKSLSSSHEALKKTRRSPSEERKGPASTEESRKVGKSPPRFPEVPKEVHQSPLEDLQHLSRSRPQGKSFKTSLQVLLRKQDEELVKNIEYKEKVEKGEIGDDDDDGGGRERGGREDDTTKEERKERMKENKKATAEEGATKEHHGKSNKAKESNKKAGKGEDSKKRAKEGDKKHSESKKEKDGKIRPENQEREKAEKKEHKPEERKESGRKKGTEKEKEKGERKAKVMQKDEENVEEEARVTEKEREKSTKKEEEKQADRKVQQNKTEEEESKAEKKEKTEVKKTDTEERNKESTKEGKAKEEKEKARKKEEAKEARTGKEDKQEMKEAEEENRRKVMREGSKEEKAHGPLYMKRKRAFNRWKEYYFVLDGLLLTYYRSQHQYEHLSGMKGSLDLSLVEAVQSRKAGLMRTHHPFRLSRRNLPSIHLGAATKGEQQRWMAALQAVIQPHRLSCHSSDKALNTAFTAAVTSAHATKAATLPGRVKSVSSSSSSATDEELEEEEEEEEEPELIQPKKVLKVPIALPLGRMNLGEVKLKKVQKTDVKHESVDEASNVSPSPGSTGDRTQADGERETSPPGELFGVVLKKTRREEEAKEASSTSTSTSTSTSRRPSKQPVIPLNSGKLLIVPEAKSPKASPGLQKRGTPERRKSPSPSLPISKSVQALTKSAEEVKGTHVEISSTEAFSSSSSSSATSTITTTTTEGKSKVGGVKLCHAQTSEVKYSDVVVMDEVAAKEEEEEKEVVAGKESAKKDTTEKEEEEATEAKPQGKKETTGSKEAVKEGEGEELKEEKDEDEAMKKDPLETPMKVDEKRDEGEDEDAVHVDLKESPRETLGAVEDEDFLSNNKSVHGEPADKEKRQGGEESEGTGTSHPDPLQEPLNAATPLTPPASPTSSVSSTDSDIVCKTSASSSPSPDIATVSHKPASPASKLPLSSPKSSPLFSEGRGSGEKAQSSDRDGEGKQQQEKQEDEEAQPCGASRPRSCTNESSASSSVEGGEKKPGKLQRLRDRLKSSASHKEKEDPASPTEKKRKGSNAFSVFLSGKKGKEGSKKHAGEQPQPQPPQEEATCEPCTSPLHDEAPFSESPPVEAMVPTVAMQVTGPPTHHPVRDDLEAQEDEFIGCQSSADDALVTRRTMVTDCEARVITYSRASGDSYHDPPPSIPEKTRVRSRSPNHDVPQSNRPVTCLHLQGMNDEDDDEGEVCQTVDGYITEEQIEALLNAKENREKRKRSNSRAQLLAVPGVVMTTSPPVTAPTTDDWANKRPSFVSFSSIDSDESLPATNFLGLERRSSSSGSFKGSRKSPEADGDRCFSLSPPESGESLSSEGERSAEPQRRAPRPTDSITAKNRASLTFPEFTVEEEEGLSSPETSKARPAHDDDDDDEAESETEAAAEHEDFFPVVGGDVKLRQPAAHKVASLDLPTGELRTSGIVGLKEFLKSQEQDDLQEVKSGISRLGHSAAVEKLKQTSSEP